MKNVAKKVTIQYRQNGIIDYIKCTIEFYGNYAVIDSNATGIKVQNVLPLGSIDKITYYYE
jgi:hypothetical protein